MSTRIRLGVHTHSTLYDNAAARSSSARASRALERDGAASEVISKKSDYLTTQPQPILLHGQERSPGIVVEPDAGQHPQSTTFTFNTYTANYTIEL